MTLTNKKKTSKTIEPMIVAQFGKRAVSEQNYSKIVCIPAQALINLGNPKHLEVSLVMQGNEKFLKLIPIAENKEEVS